MAGLGDLTIGLGVRDKGFMRSMGLAKGRVQGFVDHTTRGLARIGHAWQGLGAIVSAGKLFSTPLKLAADYETLGVQFRVLTGDAKTAEKVLGDIAEFAATTPFQKTDLTAAGRKLIAFGTGAKDVVGELRMLGDVSAATGTGIGDLAEIYGKARVQGRLFAEDINQLVGRGIPIIDALADVTGRAKEDIKKLTSDGKIGFSELQRAMESLTAAGGRYEGMTKALSETAAGQFSTLKDNVLMSLTEIGNAMMKEFDLKELTSDLTKFTKTFTSDWVPTIADGLKSVATIAKNVGAFVRGIVDGVKELARTSRRIVIMTGKGGGMKGSPVSDDAFRQAKRDADVASRGFIATNNRGAAELAAATSGIRPMGDPRSVARIEEIVREVKQLESLGASITKSVMTPVEQMKAERAKLTDLFERGFITEETFGRAITKKQNELFPQDIQTQSNNSVRSLAQGSQESFEVLRAAFGGGNSEQKKQLTAMKAIQKAAENTAKGVNKIANKDGGMMIAKPI